MTVMIAVANALMSDTGKIEMGKEGGCAGKAGGLVPLEMFNYGNEKLGCVLQESIDDLRFLGISVSYICMLIADHVTYSQSRTWKVVM